MNLISPRPDEVLASIEWPRLKPAVSADLASSDALITCVGFEDRALAFLEKAVSGGSRHFRLIGINYRPEIAENRIQQFEQLASSAKAAKHLITYDRQEPESSREILGPTQNARRIFIDISGMSRLLVVQLVAAAVRHNMLNKLQLVYTEAEVYPPSREEVESQIADDGNYLGILHFISSGVFGINVIPELSTVSMQGQPIRLVAFPSFNPTQFAAVCAEIQAAFFTIVNGIPPRTDYRWRTQAIRKLNNVDAIREKEEYSVSTFDYTETLRLLLKLYSKHGAVEKFVISPTGSKMQSVAVGLTCGFLHDLQVVYPTPRSFPSPANYTTGISGIYSLSLAPFSALAEKMSRTGD